MMPASLPCKRERSTLIAPLLKVNCVFVQGWSVSAWLTSTWYVPLRKEQLMPSLLQEPFALLLRLSLSKGGLLVTAVAVPLPGCALAMMVGVGVGVDAFTLLPAVACGVFCVFGLLLP